MTEPRPDGEEVLRVLTKIPDLGTPEFRILVLAPVGRTAHVTQRVLRQAGFACTVCLTMEEFCAEFGRGAGAALLVEEALSPRSAVLRLVDALEAQPAWSDCPVQVFVSNSERPTAPLRELVELSRGWSVVLMNRPVPPSSLMSVMNAALRNRARQYALRELLEQYEEARAQADQANRTKGEFLAVMSHELRTPLNAIGGYTELIEMGIRGPVTPDQRTDLHRIQLNQKHLLGLVNEVLSYTKLETGTVEYDIVDVEVGDEFLAAEALIVPQARAKSLDLIVARPEADLRVRADPDKLRQILVNLLSNAVKFTPPGGSVRLEGEASGRTVLISVRDTGIGIPEDKLAAVFEPFVQVSSDLTRTQEGTGLGLAISRNLARGMGGELVVESTAGAGSTFTLTLPR